MRGSETLVSRPIFVAKPVWGAKAEEEFGEARAALIRLVRPSRCSWSQEGNADPEFKFTGRAWRGAHLGNRLPAKWDPFWGQIPREPLDSFMSPAHSVSLGGFRVAGDIGARPAPGDLSLVLLPQPRTHEAGWVQPRAGAGV